MIGVTRHGVFCDYLVVTFNPKDGALQSVCDLLGSWGWFPKSMGDGVSMFNYPAVPTTKAAITMAFNYRKVVDRVSFSGSALEILRATGLFAHVLQELLQNPHNVTRLDLALDAYVEGPEDIQRRLAWVKRKGHAQDRGIRLSRERVHRFKVRPIFKPRELDGAMTGSVMIGSRKDRYSAIVYDKRAQLWEVLGIDDGRERVRYEMRTSEATLRDALDGDALFFKMASPDLLDCPSDVGEWVLAEMPPLNLEPLPQRTEFEKAVSIIDGSPDLERLLVILRANPALVPMIERRLEHRFRAVLADGYGRAKRTA